MWSMNKTIRVLVVDDSVLARTMITQGLAKSPRIEIVGTAFNAVDALSKVAQVKPAGRRFKTSSVASVPPVEAPSPMIT